MEQKEEKFYMELSASEADVIESMRKQKAAEKQDNRWGPNAVQYYMDQYDGEFVAYKETLSTNIYISRICLDREELAKALRDRKPYCVCRGSKMDKFIISVYRNWDGDAQVSDYRITAIEETKASFRPDIVFEFCFDKFFNPFLPKKYFSEVDIDKTESLRNFKTTSEEHLVCDGKILLPSEMKAVREKLSEYNKMTQKITAMEIKFSESASTVVSEWGILKDWHVMEK